MRYYLGMGEMHDAWFFVGIFIFIFLIWVSTGGPLHPIAFTGPALSQPQELGGGNYLSLPRAPFTIGGPTVSLPGSTNGNPNTYTLSNSSNNTSGTQTPPPLYGIYFGTPSPYINMISLNKYVSNASSSDEYLTLSVQRNASGPVTITHWTLESEATYKSEIIPQGTTVPTSGVVNATEDIVLNPGDRAIINTRPSPVGASFRENKCTGYFAATQKFVPALPLSCPSASDELENYYGRPYIHDPRCIDYVKTIGRCQTPRLQSADLTDTCESFLVDQLNYNGCVSTHRYDADFNGTTWHIYLGRVDNDGDTKPLWRSNHEVVRLIDDRGKTVAQFTY